MTRAIAFAAIVIAVAALTGCAAKHTSVGPSIATGRRTSTTIDVSSLPAGVPTRIARGGKIYTIVCSATRQRAVATCTTRSPSN
jgi:hypothetical protein